MSEILTFKTIENKHDVYGGKNCMKNFCESSREHTMEIINFRKNEVIDKRAAEIISKYKILLYLSRKKLKINMQMIKKYCKVRDHCHYAWE